MIEELQRLEDEEDLNVEQWRYLEATYVCAAGNAFFSMTSSRYGGEAARIQWPFQISYDSTGGKNCRVD